MGIFDGILICSDIDGTFESESSHPLPKENIDAVKYFTGNGGFFTFCTGRLDTHLKDRGLSKLVNAPACLANGTIIYDFKKDCVVKQSFLSHPASEILNIMKDSLQHVEDIRLAMTYNYTILKPPYDMSCDVIANKAVFVCYSEEDADAFLKNAIGRFDDYYISKTWPIGVEFVDKNTTKGTAIEYIKECVGAHTSYGIGDYGNDLPMLQRADVGVAVGNAIDELKAAADIIVCDFMQNSLADLINRIEQNLKNA